MDNLLRWYREQLDEDERLAHAADGTLGGLDKDWTYQPADDTSGRVVARGFYVVILEVQGNVGEHVAAHDPRRVLQDVEADRALIADYVSAQETVDAIARPDMYDVGRAQGLEEAVRRRASAYDQRPGYLEEWRP